MNFTEYQALARRTQNTSLTLPARRNHALFGMAAEVGEIQSMFQKVFQGHTLDTDHLRHEIGDLLWFVGELCDVFKFDLGDVAAANIDKLKKRYPKGFEADRSLHREEGDR